MLGNELAREILRQSYRERRGFIPLNLSFLTEEERASLLQGLKQALKGYPIRVGYAQGGIWWAVGPKKAPAPAKPAKGKDKE
ncbi:MAG: hypothetical protein QW212_00095 [Nitrososphaerales archaeon]